MKFLIVKFGDCSLQIYPQGRVQQSDFMSTTHCYEVDANITIEIISDWIAKDYERYDIKKIW